MSPHGTPTAPPRLAPPSAVVVEPGPGGATTTTSAAALSADCFGLRRQVPRGGVALVRSHRAVVVAAALIALEGWAARVDLLGDLPLPDGEDAGTAVELADDVADAPSPSPSPADRVVGHDDATGADGEDGADGGAPVATRWRLFTSGTTGAPKPVGHDLASLRRTVRPARAAAPTTWGLLYSPTRMAGVQVVLQALAGGGRLLDATSLPRLSERTAWLAAQGVEALSATPTLWRQVLQGGSASALALRQVTLGGEIADQGLLDALHRAFPSARVTHVFASTETGAAFGVGDGRAGFPRHWLDDGTPAGVALRVRDGLLEVHSPRSDAAGADGWAATGDVVELTGDRVLFAGRASGVVNVGGVKVWPERVEAVLREHPVVADAVVTGRRNAFSGSILVARVVPAAGVTAAETALPPDGQADGQLAEQQRREQARLLGRQLRAWCAERLSAPEVPASVTVVDALETSATGKAGRT